MTAKTESITQERTATRRPDRGSPRAGTVAQLTPAHPVAQGQVDASASLDATGPARGAKLTTRQTIMYGIAAYALARLPFDRRFQTNVIMWAIKLAVAKSILQTGTKDTVVGVERYYLRVEPGSLHMPRRRSHRRAA